MKRWMPRVAVALFLLVPVLQAQRGTSLAFQRAEHLRRGINLGLWYAQTQDHSPQRLDNFITTADFRLIKSLGFDHVRLSIDPEWVIAEPTAGTLKPDVIARIDRTVAQLDQAGLAVILDIHPEDAYKAPLSRGEDSIARFASFWMNFAAHFATTDPEKVYFEIMNEPIDQDLYRWAGVQARVAARIRAVAPRHTILATSSNYSKIDTLLANEPIRDENVIYTFHDYDPMWFSHQGASWGTQGWVYLHNVPYPSTPQNVQSVTGQEPDESVRLQVQRYGWDRWDASRVGAEVAAAAEWAQRRGVPLYCGEFGVYKDNANPAARATWLSDTRTALESKHIGWAMWDYQTSFGLVTKGPGGTVADPAVVNALGLKR